LLKNVACQRVSPKSMLNKGTGFLAGYSHSLNPYAGCVYGCSYCYVRKLPVAVLRGEEWGTWVDIKEGAAALLRKELRREKAKGPVTIFMSSSTDPYQPLEYKEQITRSLLEIMAEDPPDFLLLQTRSPLVRRDIDLLRKLGSRVRVSMTIETDLEEVRQAFTPLSPPIAARLETLRLLKNEGIPVQAAIAPVLPSSERFAEILLPVTSRICIDDFWMGDGSGGARTQSLGLERLYREVGYSDWYDPSAWKIIYERFVKVFGEDRVFISAQGFAP